MRRSTSIISNMSSGEVSPKIAARLDLAQYQNSCRTIQNGIVIPQGGVEKRPGTYFVGEVKDSTQPTFLYPFKYSADEQYMLEFGNLYIRFYYNHAQVINSDTTPLEVITPYITADIPNLNMIQSADVIYFAHPKYPPAKLSRYSTGWIYSVIEFQTGQRPISDVGAGHNGSVRVTCSNHGLASNNTVSISGVIGVSQANGIFVINVIDVDTFDLIGANLPGSRITGTANQSGQISITAPGFGFVTGQLVNVGGIEGTIEANGTWTVTVPAGWPSSEAILNNSAYVNAYISSGWVSLASSYGYISGGGVTLVQPITNAVVNSSGEIRITSISHGFNTGQGVEIVGCAGLIDADGNWNITVIDDDTYDLDGSVFVDAVYASGGTVGLPQLITDAVDNTSGLVRITCTAHGYTTGDSITISDVLGATEANGTWTITVIDANTFDLQGSAYSQAYAGGGTAMKEQAISDVTINGYGMIVVTCASHGYSTGNMVDITGVLGATGSNGTWVITLVDANNFSFNGSGHAIPLTFSTPNNYPSVVTFYEQRLVWGATLNQQQTLWLSVTGDFENLVNGTNDDDAMTYSLNSDGVNAIRWMASWNVLLLGTVDGEWRFGGATITDPVTPTSALAKVQSKTGSANIQALLIGDLVVYIQYYGKKVYQIGYDFVKDSFTSNELTKLAAHITNPKITVIANQTAPEVIVWMNRGDGVLVSMTFYTEEKIIAFSRQITQGLFEWCAGIRGQTEDEIWVIANRTINGVTKRFVEYFMARDFTAGVTVDDDDQPVRPYPFFFVDSGLSFDGGDPVTITGASQSSPVVISYSGDDPTDGWTVKIESVVGMTEINDNVYAVANVDTTAKTFELTNIDGTLFGIYDSGGTWIRVVDSVIGADHLEGQTVDICVDGSCIPSQQVVGGGLSLGGYYNRVAAGLHYDYIVEPQSIEVNMQEGTSAGIQKRIEKLGLRLYNTIGCQVGPSQSNLQDLVFGADEGLFTGDMTVEFPGDYDSNAYLTIMHSLPLPITVLGIITLLSGYER